MAAAAAAEEEVEELSIIKQKKQRKRKNNTRMNEYNSDKVSTVDMYNAYVGIKNRNSGKYQNLGDGKESEDAKKKFSDIRISETEDEFKEMLEKKQKEMRWTKETKPKGFAYLKELGLHEKKSLWVAPMVDASEHAFRILCKKYGAEGSYTPMIHSKVFLESATYRKEYFSTHETEECRPLLAQFCGNDPKTLLKAAKIIQPFCDGVDINFGCPQRIAKRGNYGAFLMDDWELVDKLIRELDQELDVPVTAKIRVYDDLEKSIAFAKMVENAGAQIIAVHGRTREQKRLAEYKCNWYVYLCVFVFVLLLTTSFFYTYIFCP